MVISTATVMGMDMYLNYRRDKQSKTSPLYLCVRVGSLELRLQGKKTARQGYTNSRHYSLKLGRLGTKPSSSSDPQSGISFEDEEVKFTISGSVFEKHPVARESDEQPQMYLDQAMQEPELFPKPGS